MEEHQRSNYTLLYQLKSDAKMQLGESQGQKQLIQKQCTNRPFKNVPNQDLAHIDEPRKYIKSELVIELAEKKFKENGKGITIRDIIREFGITKKTAQRLVKHHLERKILFTAQDLKDEGIVSKGIKRENPQRYYSKTNKTALIERLNRKNVLKDTTEGMDPLGRYKAENFQQALSLLYPSLMYIHKLQIWTSIDKDEYCLFDLEKKGTAKIWKERIGIRTVEFHIYPNGSIMVYIGCSESPFRISEDQDVSEILFFLGRVEDRLKWIVSDTKDHAIPPLRRWVLKSCDVNKDVEIDRLAQITLPDLQIPFFEKTLRAYVKPIGDKVFYRVEYGLTPNMPIAQALRLASKVKIDANALSK